MEEIWRGCATGRLQLEKDKIKIRFEDRFESDMIKAPSMLARLVFMGCVGHAPEEENEIIPFT